MPFTESELKKISEEFKVWQEFLNFGLGLFCFNAALACLSLSNPQLYACISFMVFIIAGFSGRNLFPKTFETLREKEDRTDLEEIWYQGIKSKFLGFSVLIKKHAVYVFGLFMLFLVAIGALTSNGLNFNLFTL